MPPGSYEEVIDISIRRRFGLIPTEWQYIGTQDQERYRWELGQIKVGGEEFGQWAGRMRTARKLSMFSAFGHLATMAEVGFVEILGAGLGYEAREMWYIQRTDIGDEELRRKQRPPFRSR